MPTLYKSESITIKKSFFGEQVTVTEAASRRRVIAPVLYVARCAYFLRLQAQLELSTEARDFVMRYIFERFAMAVLYSETVAASAFLSGDPERFLVAATMGANGLTAHDYRDGMFKTFFDD